MSTPTSPATTLCRRRRRRQPQPLGPPLPAQVAMAAATVPLKDSIQQQYSQLLDNFTNLLRSARLPDDAADAGGRTQGQVRA